MDASPSTYSNNRLRQERVRRNWRQQDLADKLETTVVTVKRWERGSQQPSAYFRIKLCALFGKSAEELGLVDVKALPSLFTKKEATSEDQTSVSQEKVPLVWSVPYSRNPHFTGRDELFDLLDRHLAAEKPGEPMISRQAALTQPQAIKGLGGIGKTQIAVEYAYRAREQGRYTHTFWINATNEEALITSFVALAELLPSFPATNETNQHKLVAAIKRWLEQCQQRWLLIFDNADDLPLIQGYLPQQGNGSILFTTRSHAVGSFAASLQVETMGLVEGTHFLLHRVQRLHVTDEEANEAINVVIALDGFPLALDQAGAFIEETGCCFGEYLRLYEEHRQTLLARRGMQTTGYPASVATTWSLSFQTIEQSNPAAAELLQLCAFLAPDHIPEELLKDGAPYWTPLLQSAIADLLTFNHMLEDLLAFSLVKRLTEDHLLSIHRLVQAVQMDRMDSEEQRQWAERIVRAVNAVFPLQPREEVTSWPYCLRYLEQVQVCDTLMQKFKLTFTEGAYLLTRTGIYLHEHASYTLAEPLFQHALHIYEQSVEPENPQVAYLLNNLAELYREQGKYTEAELLFQRSLRIYEQSVEPELVDITMTINNLAVLYREQGKYIESGLLFQRALQIYEQSVEPENPQVAYLLNNLAVLYREQGKYTEAEPLFQRSLRIYEQSMEPEHPRAAYPINGLASIYYMQGRYTEAEPLYQRSLHIWEQSMGLEHPLVAYPLNNLAVIYREQGKYTEAESFFQRALYIWEQSVGSEHPRVASLRNNLAELYREQGRYTEAESLFQCALQIWKQSVGPEHSDVALAFNNLGLLYLVQGKYAEAEAFFQHALHIWEQHLGPEHPDIAHPLKGLAVLYREQGKYTEAEPRFQRALSIQEHALEAHHPDLANTLYELARLYEIQGNHLKAVALYQQTRTIREQLYGPHHPKTIETHESLSAVLHQLHKIEKEG